MWSPIYGLIRFKGGNNVTPGKKKKKKEIIIILGMQWQIPLHVSNLNA